MWHNTLMTYSIDFRQHVLAYKEKHELTFEKTSEHFAISLRTLFRWHDNITPVTTRQRPAIKLDMDKLQKDVEENPDDYQWERAKRLNVGQPTIHYALKRLNISYKKSVNTP